MADSDTQGGQETDEQRTCPVCHSEFAEAVTTDECHSISTPSVRRTCIHSHNFPTVVYFHQSGNNPESDGGDR